MRRLSPASPYRRFFSYRRTLSDAQAARFAQVDAHERLAIVTERATAAGPAIIGVVHRDVNPHERHTASAAMVVEDRYHHAGLGRALLQCLLDAARPQGVTCIEGDVLTENHPMLAFLRHSQFPMTTVRTGSELHVRADIALPANPT